jgi:hypothetical protein
MIDRRSFLARTAAAGVAAAIPLGDTRAALAAANPPGDTKWDLTWAGRLRGKSRAVFDSPKIAEGGALFRAAMWRDQLKDVYGTPVEDVTPVVVFRHEGIALAMDDQYWEHFDIGKAAKFKDPATKKWMKRNPIATADAKAPAPFNSISLPNFVNSGGVVLACGLAFDWVASRYEDKDKLDKDAAKQRALQHLLPGVILQPSGFFAVLKAQEEGCNFFMGS